MFMRFRWEAFVQYLKEQILDVKDIQERSSPTNGIVSSVLENVKYSFGDFSLFQQMPTRSQWLDQLRREYLEKDRLHVIDRYTKLHESSRIVIELIFLGSSNFFVFRSS